MNILIAGGGIIGLSAAIAFADKGYSVTVLDKESSLEKHLDIDMRVYALNLATIQFLKKLNVWQLIPLERQTPYTKMLVWESLSQQKIEFDATDIQTAYLGMMMEESILKNALLSKAHQSKNISILTHQTIQEIHEQETNITIHTADNIFSADLLIITDGAQSTCRSLLKIPMSSWSYHQDALITLIKTTEPHQNTAYQVFTDECALAFLPMWKPDYCSIVFSGRDIQQQFKQKNVDFAQYLTEKSEHILGRVTVEQTPKTFPLVMRQVTRYSGKHWLIMGDAAHTVHPLAGLGLNIGFEDLITLIALYENEHLNASVALKYHEKRSKEVWEWIMMMQTLKTLCTNGSTPIRFLSGLGMGICNLFSPLKKKFILRAAGIADVSDIT